MARTKNALLRSKVVGVGGKQPQALPTPPSDGAQALPTPPSDEDDVEMVRQALYLVVNGEDGDDTVNRIITALRAGQTALAIAKGTKRKLEENEGSEK